MKHFIFYIAILYSTFAHSQKLELVNVDNVKNLPLGQGLQIELKLTIDKVKIDTSRCELVSAPSLTSKFIVIPKETGRHKIGPIISGKLISNSIVINVVPIVIDSEVYITMPDSSMVGEEVQLIVTNISKSEGYTIKDLKLKPSDSYIIISESFSMSISTKEGKEVKKERLTFVIKPLIAGIILIDKNSFATQNIKGFELEAKHLKVAP